MVMECIVREICEEELGEVVHLIRRIFPRASMNLNDDDLFFVATIEERIVGFMHLVETDNYFVLQGLGVDEEHRNRGAGTALMEKLEQISDSTGKKMFLKVKSMNPAVRLYEDYGFSVKRFGIVHTLEKKRHN